MGPGVATQEEVLESASHFTVGQKVSLSLVAAKAKEVVTALVADVRITRAAVPRRQAPRLSSLLMACRDTHRLMWGVRKLEAEENIAPRGSR
jgi:hypothetical protein